MTAGTHNTVALDADTHDLYLDSSGNMAFHTAFYNVVAQRIKCKLQTLQGEWYQNSDMGVPYLDAVFVKNPDLKVIRALLVSAISSVPGVTQITNLTLSLGTDRTLTVTFTVTCSDGSTATGSL